MKIGDYVTSNLQISGGAIAKIVAEDFGCYIVKGFNGGSTDTKYPGCHIYSKCYCQLYKTDNVYLKQIYNN